MHVELFRQTSSTLKQEKSALFVARSWNKTTATREKLLTDNIPVDNHLAAALLGGRVIKECWQTGAIAETWRWEGAGFFTLDLKGRPTNCCTDCGFETTNIAQPHPPNIEAIVEVERNKSEPITAGVGWDSEKKRLIADERPGALTVVFKRCLGGLLI